MNKEFKPLKVTFHVYRDLSDCRKPRYMVKMLDHVIADGRTLNEARDSISDRIKHLVEPEFVVMAE